MMSSGPNAWVLSVVTYLCLTSPLAGVEGEGTAALGGPLKLGLLCVMGDPLLLLAGLRLKKGTDAPSRFQPALMVVAAAEICHSAHSSQGGTMSQPAVPDYLLVVSRNIAFRHLFFCAQL